MRKVILKPNGEQAPPRRPPRPVHRRRRPSTNARCAVAIPLPRRAASPRADAGAPSRHCSASRAVGGGGAARGGGGGGGGGRAAAGGAAPAFGAFLKRGGGEPKKRAA